MPQYKDPADAVDAHLKVIEKLTSARDPLYEYKHPVAFALPAVDGTENDDIQPVLTEPAPDIHGQVVAFRTHPLTHPPQPLKGPRVWLLTDLNERCTLAIGEEVMRSESIPGMSEKLEERLGTHVFNRYMNSAKSVRKSLNAGETPRVLVAKSSEEVDASINDLLSKTSREDDTLLKSVLDDLLRTR